MRDKRVGESLWEPWDGTQGGNSYITLAHVDCENEIVRRALASSMQRDGVVESLGGGFSALEEARFVACWVGTVDGDREYILCDESGETEDGHSVDLPLEATVVYLE